jgi:hypothetical protein
VPLFLNGGSFSKALAPPIFPEEDNIFQKLAPLVVAGITIELQPTKPIFEKCSHLREKEGVLICDPEQILV